MGRDESQSFAGFAPEPSAMAPDTRAGNKGNDNDAGIVHQTPRMKPEEAEAVLREQEKAKLGSKRPQRGARNEFVSYLEDTRIVRGRNDDPLKGPPKEDGSAVYAPDQTNVSYPNHAHETRNDMSKSVEKSSAGAKKVVGRRGIEEDGDDAAALPAMYARDRVQAESPVGQWASGGRAPIAPLGNVTVGAVAVEGAGGTSLDRIERGEGDAAAAGIRSEPSLISAELVTGQNAMDPDEIREMLRSELQAELRNNIVQAEVLPPAETAAALASSSQEAPPQPPAKPFWTRRKLCIAALVALLLIAGGAAAAALLLTNGDNNRGGAANANSVGATAQPQSPTVAPTISPAVGPPTGAGEQSPSGPTSPVSPPPTMPPTRSPTPSPTPAPTTRPPTDINETWSPTKAPTPWPTAAPTPWPTAAPTPWPTAAPTARDTPPPTKWPTRAPTKQITSPPSGHPTASPTQRPTDYITDPPTRSPTAQPTKHATDPPTASPTKGETNPPTTSPTARETETPTNAPTKLEVCTREFKPVCGSDGNNYNNECLAEQAGVSVVSQGEC